MGSRTRRGSARVGGLPAIPREVPGPIVGKGIRLRRAGLRPTRGRHRALGPRPAGRCLHPGRRPAGGLALARTATPGAFRGELRGLSRGLGGTVEIGTLLEGSSAGGRPPLRQRRDRGSRGFLQDPEGRVAKRSPLEVPGIRARRGGPVGARPAAGSGPGKSRSDPRRPLSGPGDEGPLHGLLPARRRLGRRRRRPSGDGRVRAPGAGPDLARARLCSFRGPRQAASLEARAARGARRARRRPVVGPGRGGLRRLHATGARRADGRSSHVRRPRSLADSGRRLGGLLDRCGDRDRGRSGRAGDPRRGRGSSRIGLEALVREGRLPARARSAPARVPARVPAGHLLRHVQLGGRLLRLAPFPRVPRPDRQDVRGLHLGHAFRFPARRPGAGARLHPREPQRRDRRRHGPGDRGRARSRHVGDGQASDLDRGRAFRRRRGDGQRGIVEPLLRRLSAFRRPSRGRGRGRGRRALLRRDRARRDGGTGKELARDDRRGPTGDRCAAPLRVQLGGRSSEGPFLERLRRDRRGLLRRPLPGPGGDRRRPRSGSGCGRRPSRSPGARHRQAGDLRRSGLSAGPRRLDRAARRELRQAFFARRRRPRGLGRLPRA